MISQRPPAHRLARGVGALALLTLLLIGTPLALWLLVGWPLPATIPSLDSLGDSLTRSSISDETLLKAIAIVGWLAWLQIVASIVLESTARLSNRPARNHRSLPIQPFVRGLITSVALLIASTRLPTATAQAARPVVAAAPAEPTYVSQPAPAPIATPVAGTSLPTYSVERHDTLWGIAEAHLADPFRWREIADLNLGRPQPSGGVMRDPNVIQPGWVLALPADATSLTPPPATSTETAANPEPALPPAPGAATVDPHSEALVDPSVSPPPADELPFTAAPDSSALAPSATTPGSSEPTDQAAATVPPPLIASALTAASIVTFLELLRRARQRRRRPGQPPRRPTKTNEQTEFQLRTAGRLERAELLSVAVRAFCGGAKPKQDSAPTVQAVRSNDREVEILLDQPLPDAPPGFIDAGSGRAWRTDPKQHELLKYVADLDDVIAPLPSLVTVGSLNGDEVLIDIETIGLLTITGDEEQAIGLVRAIASQLSTSTWVDYVCVLAVGDLSFELNPEMRVQHASSFDAAIATLKRETEDADRALGFVHRKNSFESRLAKAANDGWMPTILVSETTPTREQVEQIAAICSPGGRCAGAVVLSEPADSAWSLTIEGERVHLDPLGFDLEIATITTKAAAAIDELLTDLKVDDDASEIAEPVPACAPVGATTPVAPESTIVAELVVNVIGPVEIPGYDEKLDRNIYAELVTYLALHPEGATDERLKTILWPDSSPKGNSFNTTVSTTRNRLGKANDGSLHLLRFLDAGQRYRLGRYVTTDLARIEQSSRQAKDLPASDAIALLHEALELVRGQPFETPRSYPWAFSEGWVTAIEATVAEAAHKLATLCLDAHDPAGALWAARQGLKACPGDEQLYRDLMLAADQTGNPAGVEAVMRELCEFAEVLEPYADVHPETFALYERLVPRRARPRNR